jgi:hypothetical protein
MTLDPGAIPHVQDTVEVSSIAIATPQPLTYDFCLCCYVRPKHIFRLRDPRYIHVEHRIFYRTLLQYILFSLIFNPGLPDHARLTDRITPPYSHRALAHPRAIAHSLYLHDPFPYIRSTKRN